VFFKNVEKMKVEEGNDNSEVLNKAGISAFWKQKYLKTKGR
jgi:hypothetical protein